VLIYWSLFLVLTAGTILSQASDARRPWLFFILFASIPTMLMIGLRWKIGPDWAAYVEIFQYTRLFTLEQAVLHTDPGFFLVNWGLSQIGSPFWMLNFVCGAILVFGLTAFCLRQPNPWLSYLIAFPYLIIVIGMSGARQSAALGFLFLALNAFEDRRLLRMAALTIVGALFHSSLVLMLPLLLFSYGQKSVQRAAMLSLILIIFVFEFQYAFAVYAARYSSLKIQSGGLVYRLAMNSLAAVCFFIFNHKLAFTEHQSRLWRNLSICTLGLVLVALVVPSSTAVDRFLLYLFPLQFAVLGRLPRALVPERSPSFVTVAVIGYAVAVQLMFLNFGTYSSFYVPYRSIFNA
jgi:hypothetical protein